MVRLFALLLASLLVSPAAVGAQTRDRAQPTTAPSTDASSLASGWSALAAGQYAAAVQAAENILRRRPWDHAAIVLRIHAASALGATRGLDAYEAWLGVAHTEDPGLLEPVAIAVLREAASSGSDQDLQRSALVALNTAQVEGALQKLQSLPGGEAAVAPPPLGESGLLQMLQSASGALRADAAKSLGAYNSDRVRAALHGVAGDPDPLVRTNATVSLARLGDPASQQAVDRMLASNVPDVQLAAAEAWGGQPGPWVEVLRGLLSNPDGLVRVQAARAIAPIDPAAARSTLTATLDDANPVMRAEAAAALESGNLGLTAADLPALRKRLRDRDPVVRVATAKILLRLVRA